MADTRISGLDELTSLASGDLSEWVDISDTVTMGAAGGTNKKVTFADVAAAVLASPTTTGTTTIGTLTGLLKGATGVVSAAVAGTDYLAPAAIGVTVQAYDADLGVIAALADPNADRILFWDDSAGTYAYLTAGSGLTITGTTITASGGGGLTVGGAVTGGGANRLLHEDASQNLAASANATYDGTTLSLFGSGNQLSLENLGGGQGGIIGRDGTSGGLKIQSTAGDLRIQGGSSADDILIYTTQAGKVVRVEGAGFVVGDAALATTATAGFPWIPTCPGPPTGIPSPTFSGRVPLVIDSTSTPKKLYAYVGGAWIGTSLS